MQRGCSREWGSGRQRREQQCVSDSGGLSPGSSQASPLPIPTPTRLTDGRPMEAYSKPSSAMRSGSSTLRPSKTSGRARRLRTRARSDGGTRPLGADDERVRAVDGVVGVADVGERAVAERALTEHVAGGLGGFGIEGHDVGTRLGERADHDMRRALANIVGVRLEGESPDADAASGQAARVVGERVEDAGHDDLTLALVDAQDGVENLEVVVVLAGRAVERLHVLREAGAAVADAGKRNWGRCDCPCRCPGAPCRRRRRRARRGWRSRS